MLRKPLEGVEGQVCIPHPERAFLGRDSFSWIIRWEHQDSIMALRRQIRRTGRSLAITIPKDLADLYEVEEGDQAEFEPLGEHSFRMRLVGQEPEQ